MAWLLQERAGGDNFRRRAVPRGHIATNSSSRMKFKDTTKLRNQSNPHSMCLQDKMNKAQYPVSVSLVPGHQQKIMDYGSVGNRFKQDSETEIQE